MQTTEVFKLLKEDQNQRGEKSHIEMMRETAKKYGLPDFMEDPLDPGLTKKQVKHVNDVELLVDNFKSSSSERRHCLRMNQKPHFGWSRMEARARLMEASGGFRFMANASGWKSYYRARDVSTRCVSISNQLPSMKNVTDGLFLLLVDVYI